MERRGKVNYVEQIQRIETKYKHKKLGIMREMDAKFVYTQSTALLSVSLSASFVTTAIRLKHFQVIF
jgi:hypothetical protein